MAQFQFFLLILGAISVVMVMGLPSPMDVATGACNKQFKGNQGVKSLGLNNRPQIDSMKYIVAGCPFTMYALASGRSDYDTMTLHELKTKACYFRDTKTTGEKGTTSLAHLNGFGGQNMVKLNVENQPDNLYIKSHPVTPNGPFDTQMVTMTDNKNFAVICGCMENAQQSSILVLSNNPNFCTENKAEMKQIREHADKMGFDSEKLVVLNNQSCNFEKAEKVAKAAAKAEREAEAEKEAEAEAE